MMRRFLSFSIGWLRCFHNHSIAAFILMLTTLPASAQDTYNQAENAYAQAENAYNIGRLDAALDLLKSHENSFKGTDRQKAYRLMSLCYLGLDKQRNQRNMLANCCRRTETTTVRCKTLRALSI